MGENRLKPQLGTVKIDFSSLRGYASGVGLGAMGHVKHCSEGSDCPDGVSLGVFGVRANGSRIQ